MLIGAIFALLAAIGIVRMPDLLMRMQVATKASTLGVACLLLSVAIFYDDVGVTSRALLVIIFVFLTAPVAAHMIGRAAHFVGVPLWEGTIIDELHGRYDPHTHFLASHAPGDPPSPGDVSGQADREPPPGRQA
jgi:multicomponent Na+:H+ antiporter subunit G